MTDTSEIERLYRTYDECRKRLLDLSLRNPLLSYKFRASSKRQLQFVDTVLETVYRSVAIDEEELDLCALPDPPDIPLDEKTEEFLSALSLAKESDVEYLTRVEALGSQGRDDEFALAEVERESAETRVTCAAEQEDTQPH